MQKYAIKFRIVRSSRGHCFLVVVQSNDRKSEVISIHYNNGALQTLSLRLSFSVVKVDIFMQEAGGIFTRGVYKLKRNTKWEMIIVRYGWILGG